VIAVSPLSRLNLETGLASLDIREVCMIVHLRSTLSLAASWSRRRMMNLTK